MAKIITNAIKIKKIFAALIFFLLGATFFCLGGGPFFFFCAIFPLINFSF